MNEQIKKLISRSFTDEQGEQFNIEKFAELIVRECMNICKEGIVTDNDWDHSYWDQACENRATAIKKHFGVEE